MYKKRVDREAIERLIDIATLLSYAKDFAKILDTILENALYFTNADAGTIYLKSEDEKYLEFYVIKNRTLDLSLVGKEQIRWPKLPIVFEDGSYNKEMVAVVSAIEKRVINIDDVYEAKEYNFEGTKKFDKNTGYRSKSMLVIPMLNHEDEIIGVMQLINKIKDRTVVSFDTDDLKITTSLASQAAIVISNNMLIEDLEELLQSFLEAIAIAIDEKSRHTGGHIQNVTYFTQMVVEAIDKDSEIFPEVHFSKNDKRVMQIAALMHDVGKITTPDYLLEKATKLFGMCDRIELVKAKAEVCKKERYIQLLTKRLQEVDPQALKELIEEFKKVEHQIQEAVEIATYVNEGREYLDERYIDRLREVASLECEIMGQKHHLLDDQELYVLSVQKGTLTSEERDKIMEHVKVTIKLLEHVHFPKKYKKVPYIAGSHHEKLNGKGYPKGLKADELTLEARILAVADIFEALTSKDRPYKKPMKISQVLGILDKMVAAGELDRDVVELIKRKKLYLTYAQEKLNPEQLDIF